MLKKLSSNIVIYGGTNAIKSLVPFLMLPILTFYISPKEYGDLALIETTIMFLLPFIMLNINGAINVEYFRRDDRQEYKQYVINAIVLSFFSFLFISLLLYFFKIQFSSWINLDSQWVELLALFTFLRVLSTIILVIFQASERPKLYAYFSIAQTIVDFTISYYLVVILQYSILGRVIGIYSSFFIFMLLALYILYKMDYFKEKLTFKYTKEILSFGIPLIPHAIGGIILAMSDRYFISYYMGNSEVGFYTVAYQVSAVLLLVSMSINQAWTPMFFRLMKEKNYGQINKVIGVLFILFLFCTIGVYFLSSVIYAYFIDIRFYNSKVYFPYLLLGFAFQSFYFLFTNYLFYYKKTSLLSMITFSGAVLNLILNYIFIKIYGTIGVAYATAITWFFYFLVVFIMANILKRKES